jgi:hypothetical protein
MNRLLQNTGGRGVGRLVSRAGIVSHAFYPCDTIIVEKRTVAVNVSGLESLSQESQPVS